jgi:lipid-A-disaccharide synthase
VACFSRSQQLTVDAFLRGNTLPIQTFSRRTPEIIHLSHSCIAVSGSVGLELLYHNKPSVVIYRVTRLFRRMVEPLLTAKYISLVNLLADRSLFPEFPSVHCEADNVSGHILAWLNDRAAYDAVRGDMSKLLKRVAVRGACHRAAAYIYDVIAKAGRISFTDPAWHSHSAIRARNLAPSLTKDSA